MERHSISLEQVLDYDNRNHNSDPKPNSGDISNLSTHQFPSRQIVTCNPHGCRWLLRTYHGKLGLSTKPRGSTTRRLNPNQPRVRSYGYPPDIELGLIHQTPSQYRVSHRDTYIHTYIHQHVNARSAYPGSIGIGIGQLRNMYSLLHAKYDADAAPIYFLRAFSMISSRGV